MDCFSFGLIRRDDWAISAFPVWSEENPTDEPPPRTQILIVGSRRWNIIDHLSATGRTVSEPAIVIVCASAEMTSRQHAASMNRCSAFLTRFSIVSGIQRQPKLWITRRI